jgi:hypothetical protein
LLALFGGAFLYGITRPRYTVNNYYNERDGYVECDGGGDSTMEVAMKRDDEGVHPPKAGVAPCHHRHLPHGHRCGG